MKIIRLLYKTFIFFFLSLIVIIIGLYTHAYFSKPISLNNNENFYLYDKNDNLVYQGSSINSWTNLEEISPFLKDAVISVEDKNFYKHNGFDYFRILKAILKNIKSNTIVEGASTISQQYIKNVYLNFDKTWNRKIKEALLTLNLEVHYSKDEILEAYLNTINFGEGNYGIDSASKYYFNKKPSDLSLEESIILAGIPKNPKNNNPINNYDNSIKRAKTVALTMLNNNLIDTDTYNNLYNKQVDIYGKKSDNDLQMLMYYQDAVLDELDSLSIDKNLIKSGNLKIYTTLNYDVQQIMEEEILNNYKDNNLEVASVIINPHDGSVMALTGGINYKKSQYNRALNSKRQVGSTMKPFLYYAALENGMTSSSKFNSQFTTFNLDNGKSYSPKNWANIYANKEITMAAAIAYSDNIYAVKTNLFLGTEKLVDIAKKCGIKENLRENPSLALGTTEINLLDFAQGYESFASGGYYKKIHFIRKIEDENGNKIYEYKNHDNLILNPNYVYILNELLTSPTNNSFIDYNNPTALSISNKLTNKYALKTGTTDSDYWTVGYNNDILMVMWSGYDNNDDIAISVGADAKNIWANTVEKISILEHFNNNWYKKPENVIGIPLSAVDGTPTSNAKKTAMFYYLRGSEPTYNLLEYKNED